MKKTAAKKAKTNYSFDGYIYPIAERFMRTDWADALALVHGRIKDIVKYIDDYEEKEGIWMVDELNDLFNILDLNDPYKTDKKKILKWIGSLAWDNFYDDARNVPYSLGSMYYNKIQWVLEADGDESDEILYDFAKRMDGVLPEFLDALEKYAEGK